MTSRIAEEADGPCLLVKVSSLTGLVDITDTGALATLGAGASGAMGHAAGLKVPGGGAGDTVDRAKRTALACKSVNDGRTRLGDDTGRLVAAVSFPPSPSMVGTDLPGCGMRREERKWLIWIGYYGEYRKSAAAIGVCVLAQVGYAVARYVFSPRHFCPPCQVPEVMRCPHAAADGDVSTIDQRTSRTDWQICKHTNCTRLHPYSSPCPPSHLPPLLFRSDP